MPRARNRSGAGGGECDIKLAGSNLPRPRLLGAGRRAQLCPNELSDGLII